MGDEAVLVHNYKSGEDHHVASNKNKTYTPMFREIADKFDLNLNKDWNIIPDMPNHHGRHAKQYHELILSQMRIFADESGNVAEFLTKFEQLKVLLQDSDYIGMMYSAFWEGYK